MKPIGRLIAINVFTDIRIDADLAEITWFWVKFFLAETIKAFNSYFFFFKSETKREFFMLNDVNGSEKYVNDSRIVNTSLTTLDFLDVQIHRTIGLKIDIGGRGTTTVHYYDGNILPMKNVFTWKLANENRVASTTIIM